MDVQTAAVANCLVPDNFGQISLCPVLEAVDTNGYQYNCPEQSPQVGEAVHGLIDHLPGCVELTYGPQAATAAQMNCNASVPLPSITPTANSMPRPTNSPIPGQSFGLANHEYVGCFNDSVVNYRALNEVSYSNYTNMTVEFCQAYCMSLGYRLSGVEYAQECHCDNFLNPTAIGGSDQCTWNCGGTMTANVDGLQQLCGGLNYINVFNNTEPTFNASGSIENTAGLAQKWTPPAAFADNYLGCYTDTAVGVRTLQGTSLTMQNMTLEMCAAFCAEGDGYQFYGTEFTSQCFCGNVIYHEAMLLSTNSTPSNASCNYRCGGFEPEICGGAGVVSVYNNTGYITPVSRPSVGKYVLKGCLSDPDQTGRSLAAASMTSVNMTNEMCVKYCLGNEYRYAG